MKLLKKFFGSALWGFVIGACLGGSLVVGGICQIAFNDGQKRALSGNPTIELKWNADSTRTWQPIEEEK